MSRIPLDSAKKTLALHLVSAGRSVKEAANETGLDYSTLRKAAWREHWPTPGKISREVARSVPAKVTEILTAEGVDQKARYVQRLASGVAEKLASSVGAMDTDTLLRRSRDIETLDRVSRRTLRLDEEAQRHDANQINLMILSQPFVRSSTRPMKTLTGGAES